MSVYDIISTAGALLAIIVLVFLKEDTKLYGILFTISMLMIIVPPIIWRIEIVRHLV